MSDVFISYAHEDVQAAREIVRVLEAADLSVFWDRDILAGRRFDDAIEDELRRSLCAIVCWSRNSIASKWVRAEAQDALDRGILVPVALDRSKPALPFRGTNTIDLAGWPEMDHEADFVRLLESVQRLLGHSTEPSSTTRSRTDPTLSVRIARRVLSGLSSHDKTGEDLTEALALEQTLNEVLIELLTQPGHRAEDIHQSLSERLRDWYPGAQCALFQDGLVCASSPTRALESFAASALVNQLRREEESVYSATPNDPRYEELLRRDGHGWAFRAVSKTKKLECVVLAPTAPSGHRINLRLAQLPRVLDLIVEHERKK